MKKQMTKVWSFFMALLVFCLIFGISNASAASTVLKVDITGGTLTITNPSIATLSAKSLEGNVNTSAGKLGEIVITDNRGTGSGWSVTLTVSDFTCCNGTFSIPAKNLTITPGEIETLTGSFSGVNAGSAYTLKSSSDIATIITANNNSGMGSYKINPDLTLLVPSNAFAGKYSATLTITII